jgi:NAD(P)H-hydrate epimerase
MAGAVALAGEAALRAGAGLVSVATRSVHAAVLTTRRPELMCHGVEDGGGLAPLLARADVVVLGPGLGRDDWGRALFGAVLDSGLPLVLDADALNLLALMPELRDNWVLTPHPGEAARLLGSTTAAVQADRFAALRALKDRYGGRIVLKGAGTLVADDDGIQLCPCGNPGMATAGMGDVLSGIAGTLLAQHRPQAAALAVLVHAMAGDAAARDGGERGLLAADLFPFLRRGVNP